MYLMFNQCNFMLNKNLKLALCRTCLATLLQSNAYNIFTTQDLANKLMLCSGLPVQSTDGYPENICKECYKQILRCYEFQKMCCKSLDIYQELLKKVGNSEGSAGKHDILSDFCDKEPLNQDLKVSNPIPEDSMEYLDEITILSEFSERKMTLTPLTTEMEYQELKRMTLNKKLSDVAKRKEVADEEEENLQVKKKTEVSLAAEKKGCLDEKEVIVCDGGGKSFTDAGSCSSTKEVITMGEKCDVCNKQFKSVLRLKVHKKQHQGALSYICSFDGCESSFDKRYLYSKHQKEHGVKQDENFKCDVDNCDRVYKNKSNLNIHKRKFHNLGPELKAHMCEVCGKVFKSSAVLNDHHYIHVDKTKLPYACEEEGCIKRFSNKEKLKIHKMRHAGIKNFQCPFCGMRKTTRNELKIHINYHTLERTWPCTFCPKVCNSAGNLKMHVKNMHERVKDFACRYCERTFAKADTKKYHEMTHTGEKPHVCAECGRRFVQPAALRTHRKIHLREKDKLPKNQ